MSESLHEHAPQRSSERSRSALARSGPLVGFALFAAGVALFISQLQNFYYNPLLAWDQRRVVGVLAVFTLLGSALGGWVANRLIQALAELIDLVRQQAEAAARVAAMLEERVVPALERAIMALEQGSVSAPAHSERAQVLAEIQTAMGESKWDQAERLIRSFERRFADPAEGAALTAELEQARQDQIHELRARLEAAQTANDPLRVIEVRDQLVRHLRGDPRTQADKAISKWLMDLIQRRMRTGTVRPDVAQLAEQVADRFAATTEGASLRAALPTLRRSAGLCPRCGQPHTGMSAFCAQCTAAAMQPRPAAEPASDSAQSNSSITRDESAQTDDLAEPHSGAPPELFAEAFEPEPEPPPE